MFCFKCGHKLITESEYCPKCGVYQQKNLEITDDSEKLNSNSLILKFNSLDHSQRAWSIAGIILLALILISAISSGNLSSGFFGNGALGNPAVDYIVPGEASQTLQQIWGVELNDSTGPITLQDMADQAFYYTSRSVGGGISKSDVEIAFQPGNSMDSFFGRLLNSQNAVDAVRDRWISLAN